MESIFALVIIAVWTLAAIAVRRSRMIARLHNGRRGGAGRRRIEP